MSLLKQKLGEILPKQVEEIRQFLNEYGDRIVSDVKLAQVYGGLRGVKALVCDTSEVPPDKGLIIRGIPLKELVDKLPEEVFWLLLTGEMPNDTELRDLQNELLARQRVPDYV